MTHGVDVPTIAEVATETCGPAPTKPCDGFRASAKHGVLFLRGRLFSFHEKQVAQEVVAGINGVTQVVNEIQVE